MKTKILLISIMLNVVLITAFCVLINKLGGFNYVYFKTKNRGVAGVYMHRKDIFEKLPKDSTDVVFLGNSLTEQGMWQELFPDIDLKNRGIAGDMTDGILERLPTVLELQPKKLFLSVGVNDLLFQSPDYVIKNYEKIINTITKQSPLTQIFVQSLIPVNNEVRNTGISNKDIIIINQELKRLAQEKGLTFIDLHKVFDGVLLEKYTSDGIHLNGEAYLIWRDTLKKYIY